MSFPNSLPPQDTAPTKSFYQTYCQPLEDKAAAFSKYCRAQYNQAVSFQSENVQKVVKYAPAIISALTIALAPTKVTAPLGLAIALISYKNKNIITNNFVCQTNLMGPGIYLVASNFFASMKTTSLVFTGTALILAGRYLPKWTK